MLNYSDIVKRIEVIREQEGLTAAAFAQKIGIPRSSLSHLVSGRNKPSLDLLVKIVSFFPHVSLDGLVYGKETSPPPSSTSEENTPEPIPGATDSTITTNDLFTEAPPTSVPITKSAATGNPKRILILFEDGSFENYSSNS
jgi:DNA-binding XRE family transcriptional regulator